MTYRAAPNQSELGSFTVKMIKLTEILMIRIMWKSPGKVSIQLWAYLALVHKYMSEPLHDHTLNWLAIKEIELNLSSRNVIVLLYLSDQHKNNKVSALVVL